MSRSTSLRSLRLVLACALAGAAGCGPSHPRADGGAVVDGGVLDDGGGAPDAGLPRELRVPDRAIVAWLESSPAEPWWVEERLAPQPSVAGDRDVGPRSIVRAAPEREVIWLPPESDRLTGACRHASGEWSAVGVDEDRRVFLARGDASGPLERVLLDDPELASDPRAWVTTPREVPRVGGLTESSPAIAAVGEDVVISLMTEDHAVLVYRWRWEEGAFARGPRTLVSPAMAVTPYLPIGGSYDDFDAVAAPYLPRLAVDRGGRAFVAILADRSRVLRHNEAMGTSLDLLRDQLYPRENTLDVLVSRVDADGTIGASSVTGTPDYEDELFGLVAGDGRVAVLGRRRRELGRDNTELHVVVHEVGADGAPLGTTTFDCARSGLAQSAAYDGDDLWVGGTEDWLQNPSGRSVYEPGAPFLVRMRPGASSAGARTIERIGVVPATSGHAELRAVRVDRATLFLAGHENGPLTHTGDRDRSLVRSDAWAALVALPR